MRIFFLSILMSIIALASTPAQTTSVLGLVQKINGNVKVKSEGSFKKSKIKDGYEIKSGDLITTSKKANAVLKLVDGSILVLEASSTIHFKDDKNVEQTEGKIFYKITSRNAKNSLKVKTPFAIIGIKGTTFIVNADENASSVKLQEGLIGITSLKEDFNLYRKAEEKKFNDFKSEQEKGFKEFQKEHKEGIVEITKEFDLHAGHTVSFSDEKVQEDAWSDNDEAEFQKFKDLMNMDSVEIEDN